MRAGGDDRHGKWIDVRVAALIVDRAGAPAAVLEAADGRRVAVAIGVAEVPAIAAGLDSVALERPGAHELMASVIAWLDGSVEQVELSCLGDGVRATIDLAADGRHIAIDARTSDALALALRTEAPIRVSRALVGRLGEWSVEVAASAATKWRM